MSHDLQGQEDLEAALIRISAGNAHAAPEGFVRDLSMRKKEYWETRPYPQVLWHWTEAEFSAFLDQHRFPPNTLRDREEGRVLAIRAALVRGEFIPAEVMADEATAQAVSDAIMEVSANFSAAAKHQAQQDGTREFDRAIGCYLSEAERQQRLDRLLMQAARAPGRSIEGWGVHRTLSDIKDVALEGVSFSLTVSLRAPSGCDVHADAKKWLEVRDARYNDVSLYGAVGRIPFEQAESVFRRLVETDQVTIDEARSLMGTQWQPYTVVSVTRSSEGARKLSGSLQM